MKRRQQGGVDYTRPHKKGRQVINNKGENLVKKMISQKKRPLSLSQNSPFFACLRFHKKGYCRECHRLPFF